MRKAFLIMCILAGLLSLGCSSTRERVYDLTVRNETTKPITIWLTKDGPPAEAGWRSPEQLALGAPGHEERIAGMVVPPQKTAYTNEVKGEFEERTFAWLRVYLGQYSSFSELLSINAKSPDRTDYALDEGKNILVVKEVNGRVVVESEGERLTVPGAK